MHYHQPQLHHHHFLSNCTHRVLRQNHYIRYCCHLLPSYLIALIEYCDQHSSIGKVVVNNFLSNCTHRVLRHKREGQRVKFSSFLSNCTHRVLRQKWTLVFASENLASYLIALIEYCDCSRSIHHPRKYIFLSNCTHRVLRL